MSHRRLLVALVPLLLAAGGCGGSADDRERVARPQGQSAAAQEGRTRAVFAAEARAICTEAWDNVPAGVRNASPQEQLEMGMDTWSDVVRQLRELDPPVGEEARVDRMLTHFEDAIRAGRQASTADDESALAVFAGLFDQGQRAQRSPTRTAPTSAASSRRCR